MHVAYHGYKAVFTVQALSHLLEFRVRPPEGCRRGGEGGIGGMLVQWTIC